MQHKGNGQWESPQEVPPDSSGSFHLPVCYCSPNSDIMVATCCLPKIWKCSFITLIISIFLTFILHSILVFSVKQQSYQLHTFYVTATHALSVSYPWCIVLHSVIVLHVSKFRNLSTVQDHCPWRAFLDMFQFPAESWMLPLPVASGVPR